jgi:hemerythrin
MGVTSAIRTAGKVVMRAVGTPSHEEEQDLLDTLKTEHDQVKALLEDLAVADTAAQRRSLVSKIKSALIHFSAEERLMMNRRYLALKAQIKVS